MNYIQIYENFITDRNKLLYEIELVDKKMENELLDLLCGLIDIKGFSYKFYSNTKSKDYVYFLHIENERLESEFNSKTSFKEIKSVFKSNVYQMNDVLSLDYDIKYTMGVIRVLKDSDGLRKGILPNAWRYIDQYFKKTY